MNFTGQCRDRISCTMLREGAQRLVAQAVQAEFEDFLARFALARTEDGRAAVVRNGFQPEREVLTGLGPVRVRIPKARSRAEEPAVFHSRLIPRPSLRTNPLSHAHFSFTVLPSCVSTTVLPTSCAPGGQDCASAVVVTAGSMNATMAQPKIALLRRPNLVAVPITSRIMAMPLVHLPVFARILLALIGQAYCVFGFLPSSSTISISTRSSFFFAATTFSSASALLRSSRALTRAICN